MIVVVVLVGVVICPVVRESGEVCLFEDAWILLLFVFDADDDSREDML